MTARTILVGYDRSAGADAAAAWALDEAARTGARVEFRYAYEWPIWLPTASTVPAPAVWPDSETDRLIRETLQRGLAAAHRTHPTVHTDLRIVVNGAALDLIGHSAGAGLVVLGSRGHSAVAGLLGSVSVAVTAQAHCPVVVVRGTAPATAPVVAGVDDSPAAQAALALAVDQASARGVPLRVVHAWPPVTGLWAESPMATRTVTAAERQPFDELVAAWQAKHPDLEITAEVVVRHPAEALIEASESAQLLLVGTRGRGALRGMLLGSVSQHLLRHSACTVIVTHGGE